MIQTVELGSAPWPTIDPFLFCVHHRDGYPAGDDRMAPVGGVEGRDLGMDFSGKDGWSMYHGQVVPGFPQHPHRGFETVTYVRQGYVDHSDSLGATARFGRGDVQWLTAGGGIVHSEMFPLVEEEAGNPTELFQIWMNLPAEDKLVEPHFSMLWDEDIPRIRAEGVEVTVIAGTLAGETPAVAPAPLVGQPHRHRRGHLAPGVRAGRHVDPAAGRRRDRPHALPVRGRRPLGRGPRARRTHRGRHRGGSSPCS